MNQTQRPPADEIGAEIDRHADEFARQVSAKSSASFIREGLLKHAVSSVIWSLYDAFPEERDALANILEDFDSVVQNAAQEDSRKAAEFRATAEGGATPSG